MTPSACKNVKAAPPDDDARTTNAPVVNQHSIYFDGLFFKIKR